MATLNIGGQKVKVGDEFLRMSPEQQSAAVEEIAANLGGSGNTAAPSQAYTDALSNASAASRSLSLPSPSIPPASPDLMGSTAATLGGLVNGIPVIGPAIQNTTDAIVGTSLQLAGQGPMEEYRANARARRAQIAQANPIADIAGQVAAPIGAFGAAARVPVAATALGMTGPLKTQIANGAVTNSLASSLDALVRGQDTTDAALIGAGTGVAGPLVGRGAESVLKPIVGRIAPVLNAARNPADEAALRVGSVVSRDRAAGQGISQADELVAAQTGIPLSNVDRGGEVTRALGRSVANQNPEARETLTRLADDRFTSQAPRAVSFIKRLTGGAADDIGYQQSIQDVARAVNKPRYEAAFSAPSARAVWNKPIQELMQSNTFRSAINAAESRGTDKAAISGFRAVRNPFEFLSDGSVTLRTNPDGSRALPSLAFWDQVKRNIDGMIGTAQRSGDNALMSDLVQIKDKLVKSLDTTVTEYKAARQGAASFFDAEDALDAGKKFANQPRSIPEAKAAFAKFTPAEKQAFQTGYASELIDKIKAGGDRRNVVQQYFGSPAAREQAELVFGPAKARELEAYVRVEGLSDKLRGALGNSTTVRQLVELGLAQGGAAAGGAGLGFLATGDWQGALAGAALTKAPRYVGEKIDARVMENVAKLLASGTRADLDKAVSNAAMSPEWMKALTSLGNALQIGVMSSAVAQN